MGNVRTSKSTTCVFYRTGAELHRPIVACRPGKAGDETGDENEIAPRGLIKGMSRKARLRAAFAFSNAECEWAAMVTLTYLSAEGRRPQADLRRWRKRLGRRLGMTIGEIPIGWILEWQGRGEPHIHCFLPQGPIFDWLEEGGGKERTRKGKATWYYSRGNEAGLEWLSVIGAEDCEKSRKFNAGGIAERFRDPDAAARYVSKEAGKRAQKQPPPSLEGSTGRTWGLSPSLTPKSRSTVSFIEEMNTAGLILPPYKFIWDADLLANDLLSENAKPFDERWQYTKNR